MLHFAFPEYLQILLPCGRGAFKSQAYRLPAGGAYIQPVEAILPVECEKLSCQVEYFGIRLDGRQGDRVPVTFPLIV